MSLFGFGSNAIVMIKCTEWKICVASIIYNSVQVQFNAQPKRNKNEKLYWTGEQYKTVFHGLNNNNNNALDGREICTAACNICKAPQ